MSEREQPPIDPGPPETHNKQLIKNVEFAFRKKGMGKLEMKQRIADETENVENERRHIALELGLPETASWEEILANGGEAWRGKGSDKPQ